MIPDEAIAYVNRIAAGRTRYEGQEPRIDEVLVEEIDRLRSRNAEIREALAALADAAAASDLRQQLYVGWEFIDKARAVLTKTE